MFYQILFSPQVKRWAIIRELPHELQNDFRLRILGNYRLVFSRFFDIRRNLGNVNKKPTRKTCFSREKKRLALRIYQAKFGLAAFL